jgi:hypothetical protein
MTAQIRTQIRRTSTGTVTLTYETEIGDVVTREFTEIGMYVYEYNRNGNTRQVCVNLAQGGHTLYVGDDLLDTIRREYRAMRRAEARFWAGR